MDRWMVLRRQMEKRRAHAATPVVTESSDPALGETPGDDRAWLRNALWMLAGYLLLRLVESSLRPRPTETRRPVRA